MNKNSEAMINMYGTLYLIHKDPKAHNSTTVHGKDKMSK